MHNSEYRITNAAILFEGDLTSNKFGCLGSSEESYETRTVTKKCEGVIVKNKTMPTGAGELKIAAHVEYTEFRKAFGMEDEKLKTGIYGYGKFPHGNFCFTCDAYDEDDNKKLKAYPCCVMKDGIARKVKNGDEEVAELEMTIALSADENGYPMYEALDSEVDAETAKEWHTKFTPELVLKDSV